MVERGDGRQRSGVPDKRAPRGSPTSPSPLCSLLLGDENGEVTVHLSGPSIKYGATMASKRTTHRSGEGKKLYAVRDKRASSRTSRRTSAPTRGTSSAPRKARARKRSELARRHATILPASSATTTWLYFRPSLATRTAACIICWALARLPPAITKVFGLSATASPITAHAASISVGDLGRIPIPSLAQNFASQLRTVIRARGQLRTFSKCQRLFEVQYKTIPAGNA